MKATLMGLSLCMVAFALAGMAACALALVPLHRQVRAEKAKWDALAEDVSIAETMAAYDQKDGAFLDIVPSHRLWALRAVAQ